MSNTLEAASAKKVHVADIVSHGDKLILPENMSVDESIELLVRHKQYMDEKVIVRETFNVFPWDGAHAFNKLLIKKYGWAPAVATPGMFGPKPPQLITIETGYNETTQIPWGRFELPQIKGDINCGADMKDGRVCFSIHANIHRRDEATIRNLLDQLRTELAANSIYRGKAFKIRFTDDEGYPLDMPEPKFLNTNDIREEDLIYSAEVQHAITTNLFTPIKRIPDCIANGIPVKRGILLGGTYGTGKSLAAKVASKLAVDNKVTYLYVTRADELAHAIAFAQQYQNPACVIFCEDIDRAMNGERTEQMDDILNIIDGIDTKNSNIIVVLTTNDLEKINPAMLRPGRLDAVIDVLPPDAAAVEKLIRLYGGPAIADDIDLAPVAKVLENRIPAVISEVVKRAKLVELSKAPVGTVVTTITAQSLIDAAHTMEAQLELLYKDRSAPAPTVDGLLRDIVRNGADAAVADVPTNVRQIREATCG